LLTVIRPRAWSVSHSQESRQQLQQVMHLVENAGNDQRAAEAGAICIRVIPAPQLICLRSDSLTLLQAGGRQRSTKGRDVVLL